MARPNVLFYCTDQQRADLLGCMGHPGIRTPNFDALAARGTLLRSLHVQGTVCMPSRACILTGQYPGRLGMLDNGIDLDDRTPTLPGLLRSAGYHSGCVGRTHIRVSRPLPVLPAHDYYGFEDCEHSQCYWEGLDKHGEYLAWIRREHPQRYAEAATPDWPMRDDAYSASWWTLEDDKTMTAWVTDRSLEWIRRHRESGDGRPFFLWAGTWDPHSRYIVPPPWDRRYPPEDIPLPYRTAEELDLLPPHFRRDAMTSWPLRPDIPLDRVVQNSLSIYWGTISHIDDQFGRLMRGLADLALLDDTIVVFTSDHGEMAHNHWVWNKGPYFFDDALRVPGILAGPGVTRGLQSDALIEEVDLAPTLLDLLGAETPDSVQGRSFRALLEGRSNEHREDVFSEYRGYPMERFWKHLTGHSVPYLCSVRTGEARLTCYDGQSYGELYDFTTDPHCLANRWADPAYAGLKREMKDRLLARLMRGASLPDRRVDLW